MEDLYQQGFPVPSLFVNPPADAVLYTEMYIDFARKAVSAIDPGIIQRIAANIQLSFVPEKEKESEVCFINSEEVRPEFKLSFAPVDLSDYILAVLHHSYNARHKPIPETGRMSIPYPKDAVGFWKLVKLGEKLRHDQDLKILPE
ncbi:type ISP restriction/modification enzyme [Agriterribacter humi]|uniref:type ISP restriction/modification enzyme n=1 Tax=Agriterribacter humi TaxID=1104781 RepID=UPI001265698F|nr:type ISP restriction/modification enzyme [Agriterribacter humi]